MNKNGLPIIYLRRVAGVAAILLFFFVLPAHALEVTYPSFIPLRDSMTLGELTKVLFGTLIGISSLAAVAMLIYIGFRFAISAGNPSALQEAQRRFVEILIGIGILLLTTLILGTINPRLVALPSITLRLPEIRPTPIIPPITPPGTGGMDYTPITLGRTLNETKTFLDKLTEDLPLAVMGIQQSLNGCTQSACGGGGPVPHPQDRPSTCTSTDPISGEKISKPCTIPCGQTVYCSSSSCNAPAPNNEPCSGRTAAHDAIAQTSSLLSSLNEFWDNSVQPKRAAIQRCVRTSTSAIINYSIATFLFLVGEKSDYKESTDYFCIPRTKTGITNQITLPLDALIEKERALINSLSAITSAVSSCSCSNAQFTCGKNNCGEGSSACSETSAQACVASSWDSVAQINKLRTGLETLRYTLLGQKNLVDTLGQVSLSALKDTSVPDFYFATCDETRGSTADNKTCSASLSCCPNQTTRDDIAKCENEDFYYCNSQPPPRR